jgi:hypothetical protein
MRSVDQIIQSGMLGWLTKSDSKNVEGGGLRIVGATIPPFAWRTETIMEGRNQDIWSPNEGTPVHIVLSKVV